MFIFVCTVLTYAFILFIDIFTYGSVISYWWPSKKKKNALEFYQHFTFIG